MNYSQDAIRQQNALKQLAASLPLMEQGDREAGEQLIKAAVAEWPRDLIVEMFVDGLCELEARRDD